MTPKEYVEKLHEKARELHELEQAFKSEYPDKDLVRTSRSCQIKLNATAFDKISTREPNDIISYTWEMD